MLSRLPLRPLLASAGPLSARSAIIPISFAARSIASSSRRQAQISAVQPQDLVEQKALDQKLTASGVEADPQLDGYPQLPYVSLQKRVAKGWWDNQERRNFGETLHEEEDALSMWSPDAHAMNAGWALTQLILAFTAVGAFGYAVYLTKMERPVSKRSYPFDGLREELGGGELTPKAIAESGEEEE